MPRKPSKVFTDKELEIMQIVWEMGEATDIVCIRRLHAAERIAAHCRFVLHGNVHARCLFIAAIACGVNFLDRSRG